MANVLGFGGYYLTKKVTYELGPHDTIWKIIVDSKFLGTEADTITKKGTAIESIETDKQKCFEAYNEAVRIYEGLPNAVTGSFEAALDTGQIGTRPGRGPVRVQENTTYPSVPVVTPSNPTPTQGSAPASQTTINAPDPVVTEIRKQIENGQLNPRS